MVSGTIYSFETLYLFNRSKRSSPFAVIYSTLSAFSAALNETRFGFLLRPRHLVSPVVSVLHIRTVTVAFYDSCTNLAWTNRPRPDESVPPITAFPRSSCTTLISHGHSTFTRPSSTSAILRKASLNHVLLVDRLYEISKDMLQTHQPGSSATGSFPLNVDKTNSSKYVELMEWNEPGCFKARRTLGGPCMGLQSLLWSCKFVSRKQYVIN